MTLPFNINLNQFKGSSYLRIDRTLRFRAQTNCFFSRTTPATGPTLGTKYTISLWFKRGRIGTAQGILGAGTAGSDFSCLFFDATDKLNWYNTVGGVATTTVVTTQVFQDPTAWYHIVLSVDSTQATLANRATLYVNGVSQPLTVTMPLNSIPYWQQASQSLQIGTGFTAAGAASRSLCNGNNAEVLFVDGQALTAASFGVFDSVTGVWMPIRYNGTFGLYGFYATFQDNSTTTSLGNDYSGNNNTWTPGAGISLTTGATYDSTIDSPTNYDDTSITYNRGNYCTWNGINNGGGGAYSTNACLTSNMPASLGNYDVMVGTMLLNSGKWYWEVTCTALPTNTAIGIIPANLTTFNSTTTMIWASANCVGYCGDGKKYVASATGAAYGATYTTNIVIGVALDLSAGTITFYRNNVSQGSISISTPATTGVPYVPAVGVVVTGGGTATHNATFGQYPFTYTPPTGYLALNTFNAANPTIVTGANNVSATSYTGTGAALTVSNATSNPISDIFRPDLVWVKSSSAIADHKLTDSVRGVTKALITNTTGAETTDTQGVTAFNSNGFNLGTDATYNTNAANYIAYQWLAGGGTTSSNTSGSITSTVSVNVTNGFSIVTYTGTGANATIGHGLGVAPAFIIIKQRTAASTTNWAVYHKGLGNGSYILLNTTASAVASATYWNSTSPTSSVFSVGTAADVNASGGTYVAYCWTPVSGFSSFGTYTGTGTILPLGAFAYTGFRPKFVLLKKTAGTATAWNIDDTTRQTYNAATITRGGVLVPNTTAAATSAPSVYMMSNGFCLAAAGQNSAQLYIYAAFAENPDKISRAF